MFKAWHGCYVTRHQWPGVMTLRTKARHESLLGWAPSGAHANCVSVSMIVLIT